MVSDVGDERLTRNAVRRGNLGAQLFKSILAARVQNQIVTARGELAREDGAKSRGRTGDQRNGSSGGGHIPILSAFICVYPRRLLDRSPALGEKHSCQDDRAARRFRQ